MDLYFGQFLLLKASIFWQFLNKRMRHDRLGVAKITKEFFELYIIQLESYQVAFSIGTLIFFFKFHYFPELKTLNGY